MKIALFALAVLGSAFVFHLALWRVRLPRSHTAALLLVFLGALPAALVLAAAVPAVRAFAPRTLWEILLVVTFHVALALAYIAFYSAIEQDSPSCQIVQAVARAKESGVGKEALGRLVDSGGMLQVRIRAMLSTGLSEERDGLLRLTRRGRILARIFLAVETLFGLPRGG